MASTVADSNELRRGGGAPEETDEEDDLFEIDLDAVNSIPPLCDNYFTATGNALFANCLLPISDVSNAVPTAAAGDCKFAGTAAVFVFAEPAGVEKLLRLPATGRAGFQALVNRSRRGHDFGC